MYPPGRLESDDDLSVCVYLMNSIPNFHIISKIHISKVQVVEESAQTATHRLGEVKAQVDELHIAPEAEELHTAWADHARLVDELDTLTRTFDDVVASRITLCLGDDHRIRDVRDHAQAEMADAITHSQSISDELSHWREQQQQAISDGVMCHLQEDSGVRLTEIHSQLPPLRNRLTQLREGLDASVETTAEDYFQHEKLIRQCHAASSANTMWASLDTKFAQFADQSLKEEAAVEGDLACALSEAIASEKGCSGVVDVSWDVIQDKKKWAAQEKDAHAARLADKIARYREMSGQLEVANEGSFYNVQVHDQVAWPFASAQQVQPEHLQDSSNTMHSVEGKDRSLFLLYMSLVNVNILQFCPPSHSGHDIFCSILIFHLYVCIIPLSSISWPYYLHRCGYHNALLIFQRFQYEYPRWQEKWARNSPDV